MRLTPVIDNAAVSRFESRTPIAIDRLGPPFATIFDALPKGAFRQMLDFGRIT
jgi:hypothetical protein